MTIRRIISASKSAATADSFREALRADCGRALPFERQAADAFLTREEFMRRRAQRAADTRDARREAARRDWEQSQVAPPPTADVSDAVAAFVASVVSGAKGPDRRALVERQIGECPDLAPFIPGIFGAWAREFVRARTNLAASPGRTVTVETRDDHGARVIRTVRA